MQCRQSKSHPNSKKIIVRLRSLHHRRHALEGGLGSYCRAAAYVRRALVAQRGAFLLLPAASHTTQSKMGSGASSAAAAPAKDSKKPVQLLPTHNVQVPSKCARFYFGLSWSAKANIDIDASAVCLAGAQSPILFRFKSCAF